MRFCHRISIPINGSQLIFMSEALSLVKSRKQNDACWHVLRLIVNVPYVADKNALGGVRRAKCQSLESGFDSHALGAGEIEFPQRCRLMRVGVPTINIKN